MKHLSKSILFLLIVILLLATSFATYVFAHGGDTSLIHGCVGTGVLNQGRLRIIAANGVCNANETALDWDKEGYFGLPFICYRCSLAGGSIALQGVFVNKDLAGSYIPESDFTNQNLSGSNFSGGDYNQTNFNGANLDGTNFSGSDMRMAGFEGSYQDVNLSNTNFTGTEFVSTSFDNVNLTNADLTNILTTNTVVIANSDLTGATTTGGDFSNVTWNNTVCPDGTNSDSNGNTCIGHL